MTRLRAHAWPHAHPSKLDRLFLGDNQHMSSPAPKHLATDPVNPQKARTGLSRLWHAAGYSLQGLHAGWGEPAFRQEATLSLVLLPLSFWIGRTWIETALLAGSMLLVMIVELLNTGLEAAIDRIGPEWHDLSKRAKDMGSAAVLLSLILCAGIWTAALTQRWLA
jgi:diacylglycerol kinase (ATP)